MNIKTLSQNIVNNPNDFTAEQIEKYFEDYGKALCKPLISEIRRGVADYIKSEGCSCCQDVVAHKEAHERIGKLLKVKKYVDGSGRNFYAYASKK